MCSFTVCARVWVCEERERERNREALGRNAPIALRAYVCRHGPHSCVRMAHEGTHECCARTHAHAQSRARTHTHRHTHTHTQDVVNKVPLFFGLSQTTVLEVCAHLHPVFQTMGLEITTEGEAPDALYIVRFGVVSVSVESEVVMEAVPGDIIGENEILGLTVEGHRNRTCIAKTSCELCRLSAEGFYFLLRSCPDLQRRCRLLVQAHLRNLEDKLMLEQSLSLRDRTCVDWRMVAQLLEANESATAAQPKAASTLNPLAHALRSLGGSSFANRNKGADAGAAAGLNAECMEPQGEKGRKMLKTWFQLHVTAILPVDDTLRQVPRSAGLDSFRFAVLGLQYPGTQDCPGSRERVFSEVFPVQQDAHGRMHIDCYVSIPVRHRMNTWDALPGIRVVLYAVFYPRSFLPPTGHLPNLDDPLPLDELQETGTQFTGSFTRPAMRSADSVFSTRGNGGLSAERSFGDITGDLNPSDNDAAALAEDSTAKVNEAQYEAVASVQSKLASERHFFKERERVEAEVSRKHGRTMSVFSETHKAGILALAAGQMCLKTLVTNRDRRKEMLVIENLSILEHSRHPNNMAKRSAGAARFLGDHPDVPALLYCRMNKRGEFATPVSLLFYARVERPLAPSSLWRRILKNFEVLQPSGYFRNKTRKHITVLQNRFGDLLRGIESENTSSFPMSTGQGNDIRELTRLVKGLYTHVCDMQGTLIQVQDRLSRQETQQGRHAVCKCQGGGVDSVSKQPPRRDGDGEGAGARGRSGRDGRDGKIRQQEGRRLFIRTDNVHSPGPRDEGGSAPESTDGGGESCEGHHKVTKKTGSAGESFPGGGMRPPSCDSTRNAIEPSPSPARKAAAPAASARERDRGEAEAPGGDRAGFSSSQSRARSAAVRRGMAASSSSSSSEEEQSQAPGAPRFSNGSVESTFGDSPQLALTRRTRGDAGTERGFASTAISEQAQAGAQGGKDQDGAVAQSPTWQAKADSFLRDNVVQNFYT